MFCVVKRKLVSNGNYVYLNTLLNWNSGMYAAPQAAPEELLPIRHYDPRSTLDRLSSSKKHPEIRLEVASVRVTAVVCERSCTTPHNRLLQSIDDTYIGERLGIEEMG